jgi:hypothetical protein
MKNKLRKEIKHIIKKESLDCSISEFQDDVNWFCISECQKLSEDFIREFQDRVNWIYISKYQKLSEQFIKEFEDKVDWHHIYGYQELSEEFIYELSFYMDTTIFKQYFIETSKISPKRLKELEKKNSIKSRFELIDL